MHYRTRNKAAGQFSETVEAAMPERRGAKRRSLDARRPVVAVVEDGGIVSQEFGMVCEFFDIAVHPISTYADLGTVLPTLRPMAVVCEAEGAGQDGCNVMKAVAGYDRALPVMIVTGTDPLLAGAIDAVGEVWQLTQVTALPAIPNAAGLVDFLFRAGRRAHYEQFTQA
ncbi:MAG: hypothetical protein JSR21_00125 [Proteobacteria bacterium]|nr:hypothetical protein [Pseudomonadota bacterium]